MARLMPLALSLVMYAALVASAVVPDARFSCASAGTNRPWRSRTLIPHGYFSFHNCTFSGNNVTSTGICTGTCNKGYSGAITVTCTNNKWDTPSGSCVADKKCFGLPQPGGAAKFPTSCRGKTTGFVCKSKDGASCSTCSARGKWMNVTACGGSSPAPSPATEPSPSPSPGGDFPKWEESWEWCLDSETALWIQKSHRNIDLLTPFVGAIGLVMGNAELGFSIADDKNNKWCADESSSGPGLLLGDTATCKQKAFHGFVAMPGYNTGSYGFQYGPDLLMWLESVDVAARGPGMLTFSNWDNVNGTVNKAVAAGTSTVKFATPLKYKYSEDEPDINVMLWAPNKGDGLTVKCFRGGYMVPG